MIKEKKQQINNVIKVSIPAILTKLATIAMQYIDSAMVGRLGENASAAIGLVSTTTWLFSGILSALAVGFSVQIAYHFGAKEYREGRIVLRHGLIFTSLIAFILLIIGCSIAYPLPILLRADFSIWNDATLYFIVFALSYLL